MIFSYFLINPHKFLYKRNETQNRKVQLKKQSYTQLLGENEQ